MWSIPVTLGGGITIENGAPSGFSFGSEGACLLPDRVPTRLDLAWLVGGLHRRPPSY